MSEWTLSGLRVVREVALTGSFTAAARSLGFSQPAISRQVAAAEAAAGVALFRREARGVVPSPAGRAVADHAARVLTGVDDLERDLEGLRGRLAGRVVLGAFPTAAAVLVPRTIAAAAERHPGLRLAPVETSTPTLLRRLRAGRVDVAVIGTGTGLPDYDLAGLEHEVVLSGELGVALPAGHRLAGTSRVGVDELRGERWIVGERVDGDPQFGAWPTLRDPDVRYAVRSWPARLGLVAAGLGVSVLPRLAAASVPGGVVVVRVDGPAWAGRATAVATRAPRGDAAAAVVAILREVAAAVGSDRAR